MADITTVAALIGAIIWIGLVLGACAKLASYHTRRLLRCPETGGVALVSIKPIKPSADSPRKEPGLRVIQCQLWPERRNCSRGCLTGYDAAAQPYGFDLLTLRRFSD